ncbi:MAG: Rap1a/Tai family immunity protein [Pseudolabrys sp.]|nr:Rap1a/Tai family immunity protein [Pseudolabrys sp.]
MSKLHASFLALALLGLASFASAATAHAQQPDPKSHPGVWQDVMRAPVPESPYGTGFTGTERVIERCTALEWAIRKGKNGNIRWYRRNYQTGYCLGWINSAMAFLNFHNEAGNHTLAVCMPEDMQSIDVLKAFLDYVHKNPDEIKYNPSLLIYWALLDKYPCKS